MLAAARSLSSLSHTSFLQNQQLAHAGATLSAKNTRDHIVYRVVMQKCQGNGRKWLKIAEKCLKTAKNDQN